MQSRPVLFSLGLLLLVLLLFSLAAPIAGIRAGVSFLSSTVKAPHQGCILVMAVGGASPSLIAIIADSSLKGLVASIGHSLGPVLLYSLIVIVHRALRICCSLGFSSI